MTFAADLKAFAARSQRNAELVHKKVAIELFARVIQRTPVDTGRLRGNWQAGVNDYVLAPRDAADPSGQAAIGAATAVVVSARPHAALTLSNNLPYARRIEYDSWSRQAPAGMVRITAAEFAGIVAGVVVEVVS